MSQMNLTVKVFDAVESDVTETVVVNLVDDVLVGTMVLVENTSVADAGLAAGVGAVVLSRAVCGAVDA